MKTRISRHMALAMLTALVLAGCGGTTDSYDRGYSGGWKNGATPSQQAQAANRGLARRPISGYYSSSFRQPHQVYRNDAPDVGDPLNRQSTVVGSYAYQPGRRSDFYNPMGSIGLSSNMSMAFDSLVDNATGMLGGSALNGMSLTGDTFAQGLGGIGDFSADWDETGSFSSATDMGISGIASDPLIGDPMLDDIGDPMLDDPLMGFDPMLDF